MKPLLLCMAPLFALLSGCDDGRDWDAAFARAKARRVQYARDVCAPNPVKSYDGDVVVCEVKP